ncbi:KOW motif-containing protein [Streptomyces sp. NPDC004542]|uniref:KOW motif-containing protein n=1 Tax=Streptomyces sp. NPDC004542 TaxID=3154281 RepID=UPI0033ABA428
MLQYAPTRSPLGCVGRHRSVRREPLHATELGFPDLAGRNRIAVSPSPTKETPVGTDRASPLARYRRSGAAGHHREVSRPTVPRLRPGNLVLVTDGRFAQSTGPVRSVDRKRNRMELVVRIFGDDTRVDVPPDPVEKVPSA